MLRLGQATAVLRLLSTESCLGTVVGISPRRSASGEKKKEILLHVHGKADCGIAEIQMNRPHAKNALGKVFVDELYEILDVLHFDASIRAVIVKSKVKGVFCAGADLKERVRMSDAEADHFVQRLRSLMDNISALPMPTIAAIDGYALGGGLEVALACDLRVAASSAKMGLIETTRGLLPGAGGTQRLSRHIGIGLAKELIFTGRQIDGQEAFSMGLLNHTVPQNEEGDAAYLKALALAEEIVPQAPIAVRLAKLAINKGIEVDIASGMAIERMCYAQNLPTRDRQEGMAAFSEKRLPKFTGTLLKSLRSPERVKSTCLPWCRRLTRPRPPWPLPSSNQRENPLLKFLEPTPGLNKREVIHGGQKACNFNMYSNQEGRS